jgi:hypothetical protein
MTPTALRGFRFVSLIDEEVLERNEQVATQSALVPAHGLEVSTFQPPRKKTLGKIPCLLHVVALASNKCVKRRPIGPAENVQSGVGLSRAASRGEDNAPASRRKNSSARLGVAAPGRRTRHDVAPVDIGRVFTFARVLPLRRL